MQVREIMTAHPACCTPESSLTETVRLMIDHDCGEIPVVQNLEDCMPLGVITDRDIVCRTIGKGLNPLEMNVADCMSYPLVSVKEDTSLDECYKVLEENQIRRMPIVDARGSCVGIVSLADIARNASRADSGEVLQEVSAPTTSASNIGSSPSAY
ncbi:MAG: CBS domain-containing protein [Acidobacteria bacterium]|nr:CBS domain-containing protein [Acidobacteriota bacterium]